MPAPESWNWAVQLLRLVSDRNEGQEFLATVPPERLEEAVGRLPRQHAAIFCDVYYHQMPVHDLARKMKLSPQRVQAIYFRALKMLQQCLKPQR
jgi:DNA-directed RNA polymerase specialized sigma24 family protein